jgi:hypothetical protein
MAALIALKYYCMTIVCGFHYLFSDSCVRFYVGHAIAQAVSRPSLVKWDLWWTKWRWDRFSPSISVFPAILHSTKFPILARSGRRAELTQSGLHPPLCEFILCTNYEQK